MSAALPKLPVGIQNFEEVRTNEYVYVDKTRYLVDLIDGGKVYFLSRPRRFGKSMTVSTLDALFSGRKDLFEGLYAQEFMNRPDFFPSPVVRLDMSRTTTDMGVDDFRASILDILEEAAQRYGVALSKPSPDRALYELIGLLRPKGRVVVLVDEYDKPIIDCLDDPEKANAFRSAMRGFYTQIKAADEYTRFVFVTGITKFTRTGVFSAMNNLYDISMDDRFAAMLGYTQEELCGRFAPHIAQTAEKLGLSEGDLLGRIREYYDGFSFDGATRLYNPFSTLSFFVRGSFQNFWFESGSPSFLVNYVKTRDLDMEDFRGIRVRENFADVREIELASPESFLFQAGYLTVRERLGASLILDYPNMEVLSSLSQLFMRSVYSNDDSRIDGASLDLEASFDEGGVDAMIGVYNRILSMIPYDIYEREEKNRGGKQGEAFYHALLLVLLWSSKIPAAAERHSHRGRSDIEIEYRNKRYIVELKTAEGKSACERAANEALEQIEVRGYADGYGSPSLVTRVGLAVDRTARQVGAYRIATVVE